VHNPFFIVVKSKEAIFDFVKASVERILQGRDDPFAIIRVELRFMLRSSRYAEGWIPTEDVEVFIRPGFDTADQVPIPGSDV